MAPALLGGFRNWQLVFFIVGVPGVLLAGLAGLVAGALSMAGFALGTVPALVMVGWGGLIMRRRLRTAARWVSPPLLAGNALVMLALASQRL